MIIINTKYVAAMHLASLLHFLVWNAFIIYPTYLIRLHDFNNIFITSIKIYNCLNYTFVAILVIIIIIIILESAVQGWERVRTLSVQRPQPHSTNPWKEEKDKTVGDKKERADHANRKALALLLKPTSSTPSNTGSLVLQYSNLVVRLTT